MSSEEQVDSVESSVEKEEELNEGSELKNFSLQTKVSATLFSSARPISARKIADVLDREVGSIENALLSLIDVYDDEIHGFSLKEIAGKWQFRTAPGLASVVRRLYPSKGRRLSRAAAETLAVIAYKQPVHRADIESVRGVDALPTLKTLLDAKLVRVVGKEDSLGNPVLYGTTTVFLEKFGLRDLSELPSLTELERIEGDPGESFPIEIDDSIGEENGASEESASEEGLRVNED